MTISKRMLGMLLISVMISACSSATMRGSWADPEHTRKLENVYLVGITQDDLIRRLFEDSFSSSLINQGVKTVPSYKDLPRNAELDREKIIETLAKKGFDSVLFTEVISQRNEVFAYSGYAYYGGPSGFLERGYFGSRDNRHYFGSHNSHYIGGDSYYNRYFGYGHRGYRRYNAVIYQPATFTEFTVFTVESVLYDLQTKKKIWLAELETDDITNIEKMVRDYVKVVTSDLAEKGLI